MPSVEPFILPFVHNFKTYRLRVEQVYLDNRKEQFRIGSKRRHMIIETNRPFFRNRGLKHRKPDVTHVSGVVHFGSSYDTLVKAVLEFADKPVCTSRD